MLYSEFQTLEFAGLFAALQAEEFAVTSTMNFAAVALALGAVTKSAQLPFHTWLPQTLETPTPVSALMHAGVVNAGGYLIIRMSPLLSETPVALSLLAISGTLTACYAAVVMLTQTSIKSALAYSTIAQMGFMMLQCGLGAFSAAMLHILAHSLYKAYAFLNSGNVLVERGASSADVAITWSKLVAVAGLLMVLLSVCFAVLGNNLLLKPGGILLGGILCLALTEWIANVIRSGEARLLARSLVTAAGLCLGYAISFALVDSLVARTMPPPAAMLSTAWVSMLVVGAFAALLTLQFRLANPPLPSWLGIVRVHAANGFYFEAFLRRLFTRLASE